MPIASYETPKHPLTPDNIARGIPAPQARAAFAVEWEPGQEEAAITEATIAHEHVRDAVLAELDAAFDAVVLQIMATQIAAARQQVTR